MSRLPKMEVIPACCKELLLFSLSLAGCQGHFVERSLPQMLTCPLESMRERERGSEIDSVLLVIDETPLRNLPAGHTTRGWMARGRLVGNHRQRHNRFPNLYHSGYAPHHQWCDGSPEYAHSGMAKVGVGYIRMCCEVSYPGLHDKRTIRVSCTRHNKTSTTIAQKHQT